jgi:hypothetical protein
VHTSHRELRVTSPIVSVLTSTQSPPPRAHRRHPHSSLACPLQQALGAPPARGAPPPPPTRPSPPALSPVLLDAPSPCSPALPAVPPATPALARKASSLPAAPAVPSREASTLHPVALTPHPGGKKPTPQAGQVPYVRVTFTASPHIVWRKRVCSPRAQSGLPQVVHLGRSASISAHVAFGCSFLHWVIPSTSRSPALTRLASAHSAPVCSSWLSCSRLSLLVFSLYSTTSRLCAKNETHT